MSTVKLFRPYWRPAYSVASLAIQTATLGLATGLLVADASLIISNPDAFAAQIEKIGDFARWGVQLGLLGLAVASAATICLEARRLLASKRRVAKAVLRAVL